MVFSSAPLLGSLWLSEREKLCLASEQREVLITVPSEVQDSGRYNEDPRGRVGASAVPASGTLTVARRACIQPGRSAGRSCSCLQTERERECCHCGSPLGRLLPPGGLPGISLRPCLPLRGAGVLGVALLLGKATVGSLGKPVSLSLHAPATPG